MIRRMTETDLAEAARLEMLYFSLPWSKKQLGESLRDPKYLFLVAEEEEKVVGYGGLFRVLDEGNITNIVIDEAYRGRGLGKLLAASLLEEGRSFGIREFTLEVRVGNLVAIHVYEELGFAKEGIRKHFYEHPAEDALIMWKRQADTTSNLLFR